MKRELVFKKWKLSKKISGFTGHDSHYCIETDWQLRKYLVGELEKVRDRLADLMVNRPDPDPLREKFGYSLKTMAYLKVELSPVKSEEGLASALSSEVEEHLLDAALVLLEKIEGLHTPLDLIEVADSMDRIKEALDLFDEGLAEVDDLFQLRRRFFEEGTLT